MRRDRDRLDTLIVKEKFGFLFNGYKRKFYYWEIAIMYRKVLMIFISVFLNRIGLIVQALVILIVLVFFIQVNNLKRPFADRTLNEIENISLLTSTITIYCGIFFLSSEDSTSQSFDKNRDFSMTETGSIVLFLFIVGSNALFILIWSVRFYFIVREMVRDKYPKIYIYIFLCCRKDRWVRENIQRAKNEKNEYMIAKIEDIQYFMKDMKTMYINHINYEGHEDFMKLLYIIEDMKPKIDMTIKKNEFKVDGKIARERRFDPEHLNRALNDMKLDVNESFESKGSYSNSESISKKKPNTSNQNDQQSEKYLPESKDDLLNYFGKRHNIQKINRNHNKIYDILSKENHDFTPFANPVEEEKMQKLQEYFKMKFKDPALSTSYKRENTGFIEEPASAKKSIHSTMQPDASMEGEGNTTSNQILAGYNEYENDMGLADNYMSKINMSRNAKILMKKSKPTRAADVHRLDTEYALPEGDNIEEEDLVVNDYDEDIQGEHLIKSDTGRIKKESKKTKLKASSRVKPTNEPKTRNSKEDKKAMGLRKILAESFGGASSNLEESKSHNLPVIKSKELSVNREESVESSLSENSESSSTPTPKPKKGNMEKRDHLIVTPPKTNNLMAPGSGMGRSIQRRRSKIIDIKEANSSKSISEELIGFNDKRRKTKTTLADIVFQVSEHRRKMADLDNQYEERKDSPKRQQTVESEKLDIDLDEYMESLEP